MQKLLTGIQKFQQDKLGKYQELFCRLSKEGQKPHTLFITCSDSRVLAELITQSEPGDLFVVKNVGNIVPSAGVTGSTNSTAAAIEFAIDALQVSDVVVCGHSLCGAMTALMEEPPEVKEMPHLLEWLTVASPVKMMVEKEHPLKEDKEARVMAASKKNVLFALENLKTYPCVKKRLQEKSLQLHGWFFDVATGKISAYNPSTGIFQETYG